jgi:hypothetical protein
VEPDSGEVKGQGSAVGTVSTTVSFPGRRTKTYQAQLFDADGGSVTSSTTFAIDWEPVTATFVGLSDSFTTAGRVSEFRAELVRSFNPTLLDGFSITFSINTEPPQGTDAVVTSTTGGDGFATATCRWPHLTEAQTYKVATSASMLKGTVIVVNKLTFVASAPPTVSLSGLVDGDGVASPVTVQW